MKKLTSHLTTLRKLCLVFGLASVALIGFGTTAVHLQATLFHVTFFLFIVWVAKKQGLKLDSYQRWLIASGLLISIFFTLTTNALVTSLNTLVVWILTSFLLLFLFEGSSPTSVMGFVKSLLSYAIYLFANGLSAPFLKDFFSWKRAALWKPQKDVITGIVWAVPILLVFHILFAQVNTDYTVFINEIMHWVQRAIQYILDIELLWIIIKGLIQGYFFYILFTASRTTEQDTMLKQHWPLTSVKILTALTVILFSTFSFFQSKLLFLDIYHLPFKEVSTYVQKGFFELLIASLLGYSLTTVVLRHLPTDKTKEKDSRLLLSLFITELIAVLGFAFHKLYAQQVVFGFKDQRLVATSAVILIFITFILALWRTWGKITATYIFRLQLILLSGFVCLFNLLNIDWFISQYNSIRYVHNEVIYKDYAYLLGNSYDNVSEWSRLIDEAKNAQIPAPDQEYYWGHFSSSRTDLYHGIYSPICEAEEESGGMRVSASLERGNRLRFASTFLERRYWLLRDKYERFQVGVTPLTELTKFNLREYQAYLFLKEHESQVKEFIEYAKNRCM